MSAKILIVDDHEIVREGVRTLLERLRPDWEICGQAASGDEGVKAAENLQPDIVVLDITMPGMSGLEAATRIAAMGLACRVLIFTMHDSMGIEGEVRRAGGHGYVVKSQAARDLVHAIDQLLGGGTFFERRPEAERKEQKAKSQGLAFRMSQALGWA